MILFSYNHKDKEIVEEIAVKISKVVGKEEVYYDQWSVQPGDNILDKISEV